MSDFIVNLYKGGEITSSWHFRGVTREDIDRGLEVVRETLAPTHPAVLLEATLAQVREYVTDPAGYTERMVVLARRQELEGSIRRVLREERARPKRIEVERDDDGEVTGAVVHALGSGES